jgi:hypothetical protein
VAPLYRYKCPQCEKEVSLIRRASMADEAGRETFCSHDEKPVRMLRSMGTPNVRSVVTGDEYHGLKMVQGVREMVSERATSHFKKHELPRKIEAEGKEEVVKQGLIDAEGNSKV